MEKYIQAKTFEDFCSNQNKLVELLNHRTEILEHHLIEIKGDVGWTKKILWAIFGLAAASFFTVVVKSVVGI